MLVFGTTFFFLPTLLHRLTNIFCSAENGCFLMYANRPNKWETMLGDQDLTWRDLVREIFEYYTEYAFFLINFFQYDSNFYFKYDSRTPGSSIEEKDICMAWHFDHADLNFGSWQAAECQNHIQNALGVTYPIQTLTKRKRLEVMPRNVNKGTICRRVLDYHQGRRRFTTDTSSSPSAQYTTPTTTPKLAFATTRGSVLSNDPSFSSVISTNFSGHVMHNTREYFDFILCIGDDRSDEYMFEYLQKLDQGSLSRRESINSITHVQVSFSPALSETSGVDYMSHHGNHADAGQHHHGEYVDFAATDVHDHRKGFNKGFQHRRFMSTPLDSSSSLTQGDTFIENTRTPEEISILTVHEVSESDGNTTSSSSSSSSSIMESSAPTASTSILTTKPSLKVGQNLPSVIPSTSPTALSLLSAGLSYPFHSALPSNASYLAAGSGSLPISSPSTHSAVPAQAFSHTQSQSHSLGIPESERATSTIVSLDLSATTIIHSVLATESTPSPTDITGNHLSTSATDSTRASQSSASASASASQSQHRFSASGEGQTGHERSESQRRSEPTSPEHAYSQLSSPALFGQRSFSGSYSSTSIKTSSQVKSATIRKKKPKN
jgi:trehalose-phosphatase